MPCTSDGAAEQSARETESKLNEVTRLLCEVMTNVERVGEKTGYPFALSAEVSVWWDKHKKWDRQRIAEEQRAAEVLRKKQEAYDLLTPEQRELLHIYRRPV